MGVECGSYQLFVIFFHLNLKSEMQNVKYEMYTFVGKLGFFVLITPMKREYYILLFLSVAILIGYTYGLDIPQALEIPLRKHPYNFSSADFNLIYFATFLLIGPFSIPIGILIDRFPVKPTLLALLVASLVSQLGIAFMFQFRPENYKIYVMIFRSIFGLAGQGMFVVQCLIVTVFGKQEYEFLMGAALSIPFLFDAFNSLVTTAVYDSTENLPLTWYIGSGVCFLSLFFGFVINCKVIGEQNQSRNQSLEESPSNKTSCFRELKVLSIEFWVIIISIFFSEACLGPVNDNLNELLVKRFGIPYVTVGKLLLIPMGGMAFFVLFFGIFIRKNPHIRRISLLITCLLNFTTQLALYFLPNTNDPQPYHYFMIVLFLLSFSFFGTIYYAGLTTAISYFVDAGVLGTAWGIAGSSIGLVQCIIPLFFILIIDGKENLQDSYTDLSLFTTALALIPLALSAWIYLRKNYEQMDTKFSQLESEGSESLIENKENMD